MLVDKLIGTLVLLEEETPRMGLDRKAEKGKS